MILLDDKCSKTVRGILQPIEVDLNYRDIEPWSDILFPQGKSEIASAERFVGLIGGQVGWCTIENEWFINQGNLWASDNKLHVNRLAMDYARDVWMVVNQLQRSQQVSISSCGDLIKYAKRVSNASGLRNIVAMSKPYLIIDFNE